MHVVTPITVNRLSVRAIKYARIYLKKPKQKVRKLTPKDKAVPKINPADNLIEMSVP